MNNNTSTRTINMLKLIAPNGSESRAKKHQKWSRNWSIQWSNHAQ